jgi:hypothetical protein
MTDLTNLQKINLVDDHVADDYNFLLAGILRASVSNIETIITTKELSDIDCQMQIITPSGADQIIELPPVGANNHFFFIKCADAATYNLDVKDSSGTITYVRLNPGKAALFVPSGSSWHIFENESGWIPVSDTWTYTSATTFTVAGNKTSTYRKYARVRYKQGGGYKYGVIQSSSFSSPNTTVTLVNVSDYSLVSGSITDTAVSYIEHPQGFPGMFTMNITLNNVTVGNGTMTQKCRLGIGYCTFFINFVLGSTSAISGDVTFTPIVPPINLPETSRAVIAHANYRTSGGTNYSGAVIYTPTNTFALRVASTSVSYITLVVISSIVPTTWASGDTLNVYGTYAW